MGETILENLIKTIKSTDVDVQVKQLCDQIFEEEKPKFKSESIPTGPNIFLSIEVPSRINNEITFLCLEREGPTKYIAILLSMRTNVIKEKEFWKRIKVFVIKENKTYKILKEFAKIIKIMRGEL